MNEMQGILGNPGVGGLNDKLGIATINGIPLNDGANILVGICGSFVGNKLAEVLQVPVFGFWRGLISAAVGAIILLFVWRMIHRRTA